MNDGISDKIFFHYGENEVGSLIAPKDICQIYGRFADNKSRQIFVDRFFFSLVNDWNFIRDMVAEASNWTDFDDVLTEKRYSSIYIYGAGISGGRLPLIYPQYAWKGYIDRNKKGAICNGLQVYGIEKIKELSNKDLVLISNMTGADEIHKDLLKMGVSEKNIVIYSDYSKKVAQEIYFDQCITLDKIRGKAFVDAGAFDGADTIHFYNWVKDPNISALVFEADSNNYRITKKKLAAFPQVKLYNQGLSDVAGEKRFISGDGEMSSFSEKGDKVVKMNSLDEVASDMEIGYIKMDIEGYEKQALSGAKKIISEQRPMLGISIYHKREDIWEIPKLILELNPNYNFFLRHYSLGVVDTVLYAV